MTQRQAPNTFRIYGIFGDATDLSACGPAQAGRRVWINGIELSPEESWSIRIHSPERVRLGYGGSGPSQLALAILLEFTGDKA